VYGRPKETQQVQTDSRIEVVFVNGKTILWCLFGVVLASADLDQRTKDALRLS
jgi:hypothetical protein